MFDSPFLYLSACSIKNRVRARLRRLREPRYLVGALVGGAYLYLVFFRRARVRAGRERGRAFSIPADAIAGLHLAGALLLWLIVVARWIIPVPTQPLQLSGAERDFLLTAPVERRSITRYKLLRSQVAVLLSTLLMAVIARTSVPSAWAFVPGMFLLLTTLRLHLLGAALTRTAAARVSPLSAAGAGERRRMDAAAVVAAAVVALATLGALSALAPGMAALARSADAGIALSSVRDAASRPLVAIALMPFALLVRPLFAAWPGPFLAAAWPAVLIALANYLWVLRADELAGQAEAVSERQTVEGTRAPARPVNRRAPFALSTTGRPEWALVWKNLILLGRYASPVMLLRVAAPLIAIALAVVAGRRPQFAAVAFPIAAAISCGLTLLGPYSVRNDLRQDLARLAVLKTWPISGERLLWGEVLAPTSVLTPIVWLCLTVTMVFALGAPPVRIGWLAWMSITASAVVVFPVVILAQVVVQNAAAVLFPAWVATGPSRPRGVEAMGQQMLMFAGSLLLLVLGLAPGVIAGGLVAFGASYLVGWLAIVPGAATLAALILAEIVFAIHLLGAVLDRTDPTAVDAG